MKILIDETDILQLRNDLVELRSFVERLPAAPVWQPIDTAPKDGTEILVYFDHFVHIAWYRSKESTGQYIDGWDSLEEWEGWWSYTRNNMTQEVITPTHWMPLPEVP